MFSQRMDTCQLDLDEHEMNRPDIATLTVHPFWRAAHKTFGANGISFGALILRTGGRVRLIAGNDPDELTIRAKASEPEVFEIFQLQTIQ